MLCFSLYVISSVIFFLCNNGKPSLGIRLYEYQKGLESKNLEEDDTPPIDSKQNMTDNSLQTEALPPIDEDSKQRYSFPLP